MARHGLKYGIRERESVERFQLKAYDSISHMSNSTKEPDASGTDSALKIPTLRQFVKGAGDFGEDEESEAIQAVEEQAKKFEEKKANEEISLTYDEERKKYVTDHEAAKYNMRELFAWIALCIAVVWLVFILLLLIFCACKQFMFHLFFSVICFLLLGTTASVLSYCITMLRNKNYDFKDKSYSANKHRAILLSMFWGTVIGTLVLCASYFWCPNTCIDGKSFIMSDMTLSVVFGSTTISVLGILGAVMFWLFPREKEKEGARTINN